jgi:hypothetical protein
MIEYIYRDETEAECVRNSFIYSDEGSYQDNIQINFFNIAYFVVIRK